VEVAPDVAASAAGKRSRMIQPEVAPEVAPAITASTARGRTIVPEIAPDVTTYAANNQNNRLARS
jgi:hypothetical protein